MMPPQPGYLSFIAINQAYPSGLCRNYEIIDNSEIGKSPNADLQPDSIETFKTNSIKEP